MTNEEARGWFKRRKEAFTLDDKCQQAEDVAITAIEALIAHELTVDAVQVVRCKDCCRSVILYSDNDPIDGYCRLHNIAVTKDFFCADGEKKEEKQ